MVFDNQRKTHMIVDAKFFNKIFEPARKAMEKKLGVSVGQRKFTRFLAEKNFKFPDFKMNGGRI